MGCVEPAALEFRVGDVKKAGVICGRTGEIYEIIVNPPVANERFVIGGAENRGPLGL